MNSERGCSRQVPTECPFGESLDLYVYAGDDPINNTDPLGECFILSCSTYHSIGRNLRSVGVMVGGVIVAAGAVAGAVLCVTSTPNLRLSVRTQARSDTERARALSV